MKQPIKTINIAVLKNRFNNLLEKDEISEESKKDICILLEEILHGTKNYRGFQYYDWINGGKSKWINACKPDNQSKFLGREYTRIYF